MKGSQAAWQPVLHIKSIVILLREAYPARFCRRVVRYHLHYAETCLNNISLDLSLSLSFSLSLSLSRYIYEIIATEEKRSGFLKTKALKAREALAATGKAGPVLKQERYFCTAPAPAAQKQWPLQWQHADLAEILGFLRAERDAGRFQPLSPL